MPRDEASKVHYAQDSKWSSRLIARGARLNAVVVQFDGISSTPTALRGAFSGIQAINDELARCFIVELRGRAWK